MSSRWYCPPEADVDRILAACPPNHAGIRDRCVIAFMALAGLRIGEVTGLELAAIRRDPLRVRVERPKGCDREENPTPPREVPIVARLEEMRLAWLELRGIAPGPLFPNQRGAAISTAYYRQRVPSLARRAGVGGWIHCHGFRHHFADRWYRNTQDIVTLSKLLGHADVATTQVYLRNIGTITPEVARQLEEAMG